MEIHTAGFTQRTAEEFFDLLRGAEITRLIDVRLRNVSQLAGFAKRDDLKFFLRELCQADYVHVPCLAPTAELLDEYRKKRITWDEYEEQFLELMASRRIEDQLDDDLFKGKPVLLCSEKLHDNCHRKLVGKYLHDCWGDVKMVHL